MTLSLSIEQARVEAGVGRTKFYELLNDGHIKAHKIGKRTIILRKDLEDFFASLETYTTKVSSKISVEKRSPENE